MRNMGKGESARISGSWQSGDNMKHHRINAWLQRRHLRRAASERNVDAALAPYSLQTWVPLQRRPRTAPLSHHSDR